MDEIKIKELSRIHSRIKELANGERFGANHYDYPPNINLFEILTSQFYDIASNMEWATNTMNAILDGQHSLNRQFMYLRSRQCLNKFETMKDVLSEIDQIMNDIKNEVSSSKIE
ncbi:MAG: hypothetical protein IJQ60_06970 [Prevotella sp.]|jgi:hypothetical protein|nr:hypothetical protein [Prevotella sp.]